MWCGARKQQRTFAVTGWDSSDSFQIRVYIPSEVRDSFGKAEGICQILPSGASLNRSSGLPTWETSVVPNTQDVHPNLPLAAANSFALPDGKYQIRLFFWDKSGSRIRNAWWDGSRWALPELEEPWNVEVGAGQGMDAVVWYDPFKGVQWSCFYSEARGRLCEITCASGSQEWSSSEVGFINYDSHIQAFIKWEPEQGV